MMSASPWEKDEDRASEAIAESFARRRFGNWTDADQAELDRWLAQSTLHRVAYLRLEGIAARTAHLAAVHAFKVELEARQAAPALVRKFNFRWFAFPLLAAAAVVLFAAFGLPLISSWLEPPVRSLSTDIGGRTLLRFADGTEFELNTDSAIRYQMSTRERTVWLDKGEVWFRVAHDPNKPFSVIVDKHRVSDIGTEFLVRRKPNLVEVALLAGSAALNTEGFQTVSLIPGDDAVATRAAVSVIRQTPQQLEDKLAWRRGMLVFRNARLADVVLEFNRYNATKLVLADPSIGEERISVHVGTNDYEDFLQMAEGLLRLRVDRQGTVVVISRGARGAMKKDAHAKRDL